MTNLWKIGLPTMAYAECSSFSSLGIANLRRTLQATGPDEVSFTVASQLALTADTTFVYKTRYTIWKDETTRWFTGIVTSLPRQGDPASESMEVRLAGPWWYFENCLFQQLWKVYDETAEELVEEARCRVILFQDLYGTAVASGAQVSLVVDWLIARGAPIAAGTIDPGIALPFDEQTNLSCASVIQTVLRWMPDQVGWFDYSVEPPTWSFRSRANLSTVTPAITDLSGLQITPRYDLQKPGVQIVYEQTNTVDETVYCTRTIDVAGDPTAIDAVHAVFDLAGSSITYIKSKIEVQARPVAAWTNAQMVTWIKAHVHWLDHARVTDVTVSALEILPASSLANELLAGTVQDWMQAAPLSLSATPIVIRFTYSRIIRNAAGTAIDVEFDCIGDVKIIATDAVTKTYKQLASWDSGEAVPTGVAAAIYSSWGVLHFDGSFTLTAEECAGAIRPGLALRISGGRTEWATMNAIVQQITEDVDSGQTTVQFGPPGMIEADSLVALLRALRGRRYAAHRQDRQTGESNGQAEVELSGKPAADNPCPGPGRKQKLRIEKEVTE